MLEWIGAVLGIILVDITLSGDNAIVIGAAAARLPQQQRFTAISFGVGGAIFLRIAFAILFTVLLQLPLLQALGGVVLIIIAIRLLADGLGSHEAPQDAPDASSSRATSGKLGPAIATILLADATMSLDNVLAIGALAAGEISVLVVGLILSIALVMAGAALVSALIQRLPWLLDLAGVVLGWTAANMLLHDQRLGPVLEHISGIHIIVPIITIGIIVVADFILRRRAHAAPQ